MRGVLADRSRAGGRRVVEPHGEGLHCAPGADGERAGCVSTERAGPRGESQLPALLGQSEVLRDGRGCQRSVSVAERDRAAGEGSSRA